ncbi:MAG: hypothetical protein ABJM06_13350 [Gilvibacter sp.]
MTKKRGFAVLLLALVVLLCWHFLVKSYQHKIQFTTKDSPGLVYSNLLSWEFVKGLPDSSQVAIISNEPFKRVEQQVTLKDSSFTYVWEFEATKDSLTKVTAYVSDNKNGFIQNIIVPFKNNDFAKRNISVIETLGKEWVAYRDKFRIGPVQEDSLAAKFSAYVTVESEVTAKAGSMMRNIADVMGFINANSLELDGNPFLDVTEWDPLNQRIVYDFCFPIKRTDSLPASDLVKYKESKARKGIATRFNGNYSIADKAWYTLIDHANKNDLNVDLLPTEVYLDDPHSGGNALQWESIIFMPIKN